MRRYNRYINKAEERARRENRDFSLGIVLINKGEYYLNIHQPDSAEKYFDEVMDIGKKIGKVDLQAYANNGLGKAFIQKEKYKEGINYLELALAKNRYNDIVIEASYSLGDTWLKLKKYKDAENILLSSMHEIQSHNVGDKYIQWYEKLTEVYKASGQYKKAIDCMDSILVLKDSFTSFEKTKAVNMMEIKYKTAEKDKQIVQNQLLIARQNNKLTHKNIWISAIITGILLLGLFSLFLYRNARHKERLQAEQIKTLQNENSISILKGVVKGEENERSRLARELHDGIGGMLSAAMMCFRAIRHDNEAIIKIPAFNEAMNLLDEMGDEIRKTAHNLMPEALLKQNLPEAVMAYCNSVQEGGAIKIDFQCYGTFDNLSQDFKLNVYRIIRSRTNFHKLI